MSSDDTQTLKIEALRCIPLFEAPDLNKEHLRRLAGICKVEAWQQGDKIFSQGDIGEKLFFVLEGYVRISLEAKHLGEESLTVLQKGDFFGEMALIGDAPRSADAYAHRDCRLLSMCRSDLRELLLKDQELTYAVLWGFCNNLAHRLRVTNENLKGVLELVKLC